MLIDLVRFLLTLIPLDILFMAVYKLVAKALMLSKPKFLVKVSMSVLRAISPPILRILKLPVISAKVLDRLFPTLSKEDIAF